MFIHHKHLENIVLGCMMNFCYSLFHGSNTPHCCQLNRVSCSNTRLTFGKFCSWIHHEFFLFIVSWQQHAALLPTQPRELQQYAPQDEHEQPEKVQIELPGKSLRAAAELPALKRKLRSLF
jgi:hypothetical protein